MKLLVSDFDGTIYDKDNIKDTRKNIDAIKRFKDNNNLFAIATGRTFLSIKNQTERFNLPYDYLICSDGSSVFDKNDKLIYSNPINETELKLIVKYLESLSYLKEYKLIDSYGNTTSKTNDIIQIYVEVYFKNTLDILKIQKELYPLIHYGILNISYFYKNNTKSDGIRLIAELEQIQKNDIYTIGNGNNDIEMLKEFNGSRVPYSYPKLVLERFPKNSIPTFIRKIESGKI